MQWFSIRLIRAGWIVLPIRSNGDLSWMPDCLRVAHGLSSVLRSQGRLVQVGMLHVFQWVGRLRLDHWWRQVIESETLHRTQVGSGMFNDWFSLQPSKFCLIEACLRWYLAGFFGLKVSLTNVVSCLMDLEACFLSRSTSLPFYLANV